MFIYAWTADPQIFWMWPVVGLTVCSLFHVVGSAHHTVKLDLHVLFVCFVSGSFYIFGGLVSAFGLFPFGSYLTTCSNSYGPMASSALAGQGLTRMFFPTFLYAHAERS